MEQHGLIMERLRRNPLRNVSLLKMLTSFSTVIESYLVEQQGHWGVLLLLPADAFSYDLRTYPEADTIVLMDYSSPEIFPDLLQLLPKEANLVFKLQEDEYLQALAEHYPLHKVRSFYSYSSAPDQSFVPDEEAVWSGQLDERLLPLWAANDYAREEIELYFAEGAFSVSLFQDDAPLSTCFVFPNEERIWEIGGVHTVNAGRRKGLAQRVVRTALYHTLQKGYIPRYQVLDTNLPSIRLAESIGLTLAVKLEHWINYIE